MKNTKTQKRVIAIAILYIANIIAIAGLVILMINSNNTDIIDEKKEEEVVSTITEQEKALWNRCDENASKSSYYIGEIAFESGLIELPFVQAEDNDYFLRLDWQTNQYSELGSVFMDYECTLDCQNIILYGHYAYSTFNAGLDDQGNPIDNGTLMFTPLAQLKDEKNYENNKYIYLVFKNEIRKYEIADIFYVPLYEDENGNQYPLDYFEYYLVEYSDSYFAKYKENIKDYHFYDTGVEYSNEDKFLTLQTCVEGHDEYRQIVLAKEISRTSRPN